MAKKKYFRFHRGAFKDSMKTMVEVNGLVDHRCIPYGWGDMSYYVLADFGGYTGQCIGMANFKEG